MVRAVICDFQSRVGEGGCQFSSLHPHPEFSSEHSTCEKLVPRWRDPLPNPSRPRDQLEKSAVGGSVPAHLSSGWWQSDSHSVLATSSLLTPTNSKPTTTASASAGRWGVSGGQSLPDMALPIRLMVRPG